MVNGSKAKGILKHRHGLRANVDQGARILTEQVGGEAIAAPTIRFGDALAWPPIAERESANQDDQAIIYHRRRSIGLHYERLQFHAKEKLAVGVGRRHRQRLAMILKGATEASLAFTGLASCSTQAWAPKG